MGGASKLMMLLRTPFPHICCCSRSSSALPFVYHSTRVSVAYCIRSADQNNRFYSNYRPPHLGFPLINASEQQQQSPDDDDSYGGQTSSRPTPLRQNIEMKRGDWICHKCGFMNFAKNIKCLECEEVRPKSQLTGGEWECPQCYFFNYGRNAVCVKCDCKRPGEASYGNSTPTFGVGYGNGRNTYDANIMRKLAANEEKAERWFSKVSQMDSSSDLSTAIADEDFPEIMPLRKGGNRFVVSTRKTPLERRLENAQYRRNLGNDGTPEENAFPQGGMMDPVKTSDTSVSGNLDRILGRSSAVSETDNKLSAGESIGESSPFSSSAAPPAPQNWESKGSNSSHVSFVPLPTDRFATPQNSKIEEDPVEYKYNSVAAKVDELTGYSASGSMDSRKSGGDSSILFGKPVNQTESKEKDQSLTSIPYKRRMATEHANNTNFVPFVPFPPDYFAKKDKQPETGASIDKPNEEISAASNHMPRMHNVPEKLEEHEATREGWNAGFSSNGLKESKVGSVYGVPTENSNAKPEYSQAGNSQRWSNGYSQADNRQTSVYGVPTENSNAKPEYSQADNRQTSVYGVPTENSNANSQAGNSERWNNGYSLADNRQTSVYGVPTENSNLKPDYSQAGNSQIWNNGYSQDDNRQSAAYGVPTDNSNVKPNYSQADNGGSWNNGYSQAGNSQSWNNGYSQSGNSQSWNTSYSQERSDRLNRSGSSGQQKPAENSQNSRDNWNRGFTGKSLEGSAVKELDPLDMSEEAKAERWFRRVAQIKDISELSNIPDEDFPEIMPMRKGVNRFVVSKRKTPLERRLTSPQYRRNLPIVSSEPPIKTENDGS